MVTVDQYLDLITSEHQSQPNFTATVAFTVEPMVVVQNLMLAMQGPLFDLDAKPVGQQLDILGQWAGISRNLHAPVTGVYFSWNGSDANGWNFGVWEDPNAIGPLITLPDDAYLTLILAKIAANSWDGTTEGAYKIWSQLFVGYNLLIQDNQNMSFAIGIQGMPLSTLTLTLLVQGYLPLRPEGVLITEYFVPVDDNPLFGWNIESPYVQGWGTGSWAVEISP